MSTKKATSFRLTDQAQLRLIKLAKIMGVSKTDVIEILLRERSLKEDKK
jgi:predicted DNA-binding protein